MYGDILDNKNADINNDVYVCPNCGAISSIEKLQTIGCPYCRTKFIVSDLLPKIVNYTFEKCYAIKKVDMKSKILSNILKCTLILEVPIIIFERPLYAAIITGIILGSIVGFSITSIGIFNRAFKGTKENMPLILKNRGQLTNIYSNLLRYDQKFNYSYFEGKISSLFRNIAYSDDLKSLTLFNGSNNYDMFSNLIDSTYRLLTLDNVFENNGNLCIWVSLYMNNYYYDNKVFEKRERISMLLCHNTNFKTNLNFSIREVNCKKCGSSFDAMNQKICPYCRNEYHLEEDDWIVNDIKVLPM